MAGEINGVAAAARPLMVYAALAMLLAEKPEAVAMALIVCVEATLSAVVYSFVVPVTLVAGLVPSVV